MIVFKALLTPTLHVSPPVSLLDEHLHMLWDRFAGRSGELFKVLECFDLTPELVKRLFFAQHLVLDAKNQFARTMRDKVAVAFWQQAHHCSLNHLTRRNEVPLRVPAPQQTFFPQDFGLRFGGGQ